MSSYINFKNFGDTSLPDGNGNGNRPVANSPLARQSSIYSLTFDELQSTLGGVGKDFGSMNMDELLKNIWTAEETQAMTSTPYGGAEGSLPVDGNLQRQGSLTLPRTLSQKTVEEVWRELLKESGGSGVVDGGIRGSNGNVNVGESSFSQRQPTLGEITLEDFLLRAGVVTEGNQAKGWQQNVGFYGDLPQESNTNTSFMFGFQQPPPQNLGSMAHRITETNNTVHDANLSLVLNQQGIRSSQQQQTQQSELQPQPLLPKQAAMTFASNVNLVHNGKLAGPGTGTRVPVVGKLDHNTRVVQSNGLESGGMGINGTKTSLAGSPRNQLPLNLILKGNMDTSSSPTPYAFVEGLRGRKRSGTLEKVVERRHRRMIKNRESAARSRARKQAYTLELEAEVAKLKEVNYELQKKQAEIIEMQKNQILEKMKLAWGGKRLCLRRTLTGPW